MDYKIVEAFQSLESGVATFFAMLFYYLAHPIVVTCLGALVFYLIDKKLAFRYIAAFSVSFIVNGTLKELIRRERPFAKGAKPIGENLADSYSMPSGHAMGSAAYVPFAIEYGYCGRGAKKRIYPFIIVAFVMIMIGLARVYMGAHYLTDILAGLAIGTALALAVEFAAAKLKDRIYFYSLFILPVFLLIILLVPEKDGSATGFGILSALSIGSFLENKFVRYEISKGIGYRVLQAVIAINGAMILLFGASSLLNIIFDVGNVRLISDTYGKMLAYFVLFFVSNFWIFYICPLICKAFRSMRAKKLSEPNAETTV